MSQALLGWHHFWLVDLQFSSGLLAQFMEDLQGYHKDLKTLSASTGSVASAAGKRPQAKGGKVKETSDRILALVQVFNTVLSCLRSKGKGNKGPSNSNSSGVSLLPAETSAWCESILDCLLLALSKWTSEELLLAGQEAFVILCERIDSLFAAHHAKFVEYIDASLRLLPDLTVRGQTQTVSFARRMLALVEKTPHEKAVLKLLLDPKGQVRAAALSPDQAVVDAATELFQGLLASKDIGVLQEAYQYLLNMFRDAVAEFTTERDKDDSEGGGEAKTEADEAEAEAEPEGKVKSAGGKKGPSLPGGGDRDLTTPRAFRFFLGCVSATAAGKGSVLSMWALDPSLFNLLSRHSELDNDRFMRERPWLHLEAVQLLHDHCAAHSHFLTSSDMLPAASNNMTASSFTAGYFRQILVLAGRMLSSRDGGRE